MAAVAPEVVAMRPRPPRHTIKENVHCCLMYPLGLSVILLILGWIFILVDTRCPEHYSFIDADSSICVYTLVNRSDTVKPVPPTKEQAVGPPMLLIGMVLGGVLVGPMALLRDAIKRERAQIERARATELVHAEDDIGA